MRQHFYILRTVSILAAIILIFVASRGVCQTNVNDTMLNAWLNAQTNIQTWSADFTQTRRLKSLTQPLTATGHLWFSAPNRFRWEIQKPSPTIALRQPDDLWVIYPKLKRAEQYSLSSAAAGPWKDTLSLLDAGFPRSRAEVESRFNIIAQTEENGVHTVTLQPKAEAARRFLPEIKISFATQGYVLSGTELKFADGSVMQNIFSNAQLNPKIEDATFIPETNCLKIIQPLKGAGK